MKTSSKVLVGVGLVGAIGLWGYKRLFSLRLTIQTKTGTLMDMRDLSPWQVRQLVAQTLETIPKEQIVSVIVKDKNGSVLNLSPKQQLTAA